LGDHREDPDIVTGKYEGKKDGGLDLSAAVTRPIVSSEIREQWIIEQASKSLETGRLESFRVRGRFYFDGVLIGVTNFRLDNNAVKIFTCNPFNSGINFISYIPGKHVLKEITARTFMRAAQLGALFGLAPEWACLYYLWSPEDESRASYEEDYENLTLGPLRGLVRGLGFNEVGDEKDRKFYAMRPKENGGFWAMRLDRLLDRTSDGWNREFYAYRGIMLNDNEFRQEAKRLRTSAIASLAVLVSDIETYRKTYNGGKKSPEFAAAWSMLDALKARVERRSNKVWLPVAGASRRQNDGGIIVSEHKDENLLGALVRTVGTISFIWLKGGDRGGLSEPLNYKLNQRLGSSFRVFKGAIAPVTIQHLLERWGHTAFTTNLDALERSGIIDPALIEEGRQIIADKDGVRFEQWFAAIQNLYPGELSVAAFSLWIEYSRQEMQPWMLVRRRPREDVLKAFHLTVEEATVLLKGQNPLAVAEQDFVKAVVVGATDINRAHPGSLRHVVWNQTKYANTAVAKFMRQAEARGLSPRITGIMFNAVHAPASGYELDVEIGLLPQKDVELFLKAYDRISQLREFKGCVNCGAARTKPRDGGNAGVEPFGQAIVDHNGRTQAIVIRRDSRGVILEPKGLPVELEVIDLEPGQEYRPRTRGPPAQDVIYVESGKVTLGLFDSQEKSRHIELSAGDLATILTSYRSIIASEQSVVSIVYQTEHLPVVTSPSISDYNENRDASFTPELVMDSYYYWMIHALVLRSGIEFEKYKVMTNPAFALGIGTKSPAQNDIGRPHCPTPIEKPRIELIFVVRGEVKYTVYTPQGKPVDTLLLSAGDRILSLGGHKVDFIGASNKMIEVAEGPYPGSDKANVWFDGGAPYEQQLVFWKRRGFIGSSLMMKDISALCKDGGTEAGTIEGIRAELAGRYFWRNTVDESLQKAICARIATFVQTGGVEHVLHCLEPGSRAAAVYVFGSFIMCPAYSDVDVLVITEDRQRSRRFTSAFNGERIDINVYNRHDLKSNYCWKVELPNALLLRGEDFSQKQIPAIVKYGAAVFTCINAFRHLSAGNTKKAISRLLNLNALLISILPAGYHDRLFEITIETRNNYRTLSKARAAAFLCEASAMLLASTR
ncbi:MAG TPA: nucleotidyltransferase domain-containing protein, partial [Candidatus Omnitrophota bacterium]|nr:nucleotidyltransferase domain-containing protein [Candidatus Omnitrophota bacterium]